MAPRRPKSVLVTDGSSVLGNACATYLARKGYRVWALLPDPEGYERRADEFFEALPAGGNDQASLDRAAALVAEAGRGLDFLVSCHGLDLVGAFEDSTEADAARALEAGFLRHQRAVKAVLPHMRKAGKGRIICVMGREHSLGMPFMGLTGASQAALLALVLSLRQEAAAFGVGACVVEKPLIWPDSAGRRVQASGWTESSPWRQRAQSFLSKREAQERAGREAMETARFVWASTRMKVLPAILRSGSPLGRFHATLMSLSPIFLREWAMRMAYGKAEKKR